MLGDLAPQPSLVRDLMRTPADFSPFVKEAVWSWSDPRPFFDESASAISSLLVALSRSAWRRLAPGKLKTVCCKLLQTPASDSRCVRQASDSRYAPL